MSDCQKHRDGSLLRQLLDHCPECAVEQRLAGGSATLIGPGGHPITVNREVADALASDTVQIRPVTNIPVRQYASEMKPPEEFHS